MDSGGMAFGGHSGFGDDHSGRPSGRSSSWQKGNEKIVCMTAGVEAQVQLNDVVECDFGQR